MNVFLDTSIVNYSLALTEQRPGNLTWQKHIKYLKLILDGPVTTGDMTLYINPSVINQINDTVDEKLKAELLAKCREYRYEEFNLSIFPLHFPVTFISDEQAAFIEQICKEHPGLTRDQKIIADAVFNDNIDVLLTTDRKLARQVHRVGKVKIMLPEDLWHLYQNIN